jgi:hypothetical protein
METHHADFTKVHGMRDLPHNLDLPSLSARRSFITWDRLLNRQSPKATMNAGRIPSPKSKYPSGESQSDQKRSDNQSLKLTPRQYSLPTNALSENVRVRLSPSQRNGIRAPRIRIVRRWDLVRLYRLVSNPKKSQMEATARYTVRGDEVRTSAKLAS